MAVLALTHYVVLLRLDWFNWYRRVSPQSKSTEPFLDGYGRRMMIVVGGALFAFLAMIHIVGFYGAIVLFMVYYMRFLGRHSWMLSLTVGVSLTVICFSFDIAMRIVCQKAIQNHYLFHFMTSSSDPS